MVESLFLGVIANTIYDGLKYFLLRILPFSSKLIKPNENNNLILSPYERINKSERFIFKITLYFLTFILYKEFAPITNFKFITFIDWTENLTFFLLWVLLFSFISLSIIEATNWFFNSHIFMNSKFVFKILKMPFKKVGKFSYVRVFYLVNHKIVILILNTLRFVKVTVENKLILTKEFYQFKSFIETVRNNEVTKNAAQRIKRLMIYYCTSLTIILLSILFLIFPKTILSYSLFFIISIGIIYFVYGLISLLTAIFNNAEQANLFTLEMERLEKGVLIRNKYFNVHQMGNK